MGLLDHGRRAAAAAADELDQMESGRTAYDAAHLARLQTIQGLGVEIRQPVARAPAHGPALKRVLGVGKTDGQLGKIGALAQLREHLLGAGTLPVHFLRARLIGQPQHDVAQVEVGRRRRRSGLLAEKIVDLIVGDHDAVVHLAFAQARQQDLSADFLAEFVELNPVTLQGLAELAQRHLVALGNARDGTVQLQVVHAQGRLPRQLQLQPVHDHALQHLLFQQIGRRQLRSLLAQLLRHRFHPQRHLAAGDHLAIDHGNDAVHQHHRAGRRSLRQGAAGANKQCRRHEPGARRRN